MVKHIVFWKLKDEALGRPAAENALLVKERLEALAGKITGLIRIEVGIDVSRTDASADLALYSEFADASALEAYQAHPAHAEAAAFIVQVRSGRTLVDYEA